MGRIAEGWNGSSTTLVEAVTARPTVETLEQQSPAGLAISQREERFANL